MIGWPCPALEEVTYHALDATGLSVEILKPTTLNFSEHRVALIGANGSGKSTLLRMLNALILPTSGRVYIDGKTTAKNHRDIRKKVGFVFTDPDAQFVMPTAKEDIALSLKRRGVPRKSRTETAISHLKHFNLDHLADVPVSQLSGGQKQLLALAGVIAVNPEVIVCDEPTTMLDLKHSALVTDMLASLPQQVIFATHDLELAQQAERVIVIDDGSVAFDGSADRAVNFYRALMTSPSMKTGIGT